MKSVIRITLFIIGASAMFIAVTYFYRNVVTGIKPVRDPGQAAKAAIYRIGGAKDSDSALRAAVDLLPVQGVTLEERVACWLQIDLKKIDYMRFKLISGIGISATDAENVVREGHTLNQVVVLVSINGDISEYFLMCANGLVKRRWPNMISEKSIGEDHIVIHDHFVDPITICIPKGGSLCKTLGMSPQEALVFSKDHGIKHWYDAGTLYVLVFPGDTFSKIDGRWQKLQKNFDLQFNGFIPSF